MSRQLIPLHLARRRLDKERVRIIERCNQAVCGAVRLLLRGGDLADETAIQNGAHIPQHIKASISFSMRHATIAQKIPRGKNAEL